ncbi:MAG: ABC transporter ATP-binding protein [Hungatella sp.]|jgi:multidrug/hemolysin transport system ATP-binding protein|nr:ABC transporter ATP-binding protein [Hungatella sp.]
MQDIITVKEFEKSYGKVEAVRGIDFSVKEGSLFSLLGPNGAGKSTMIDTLCTLLACEKGEILIDGLRLGTDDKKIRKRIGIVFQQNLLDDFLTIRENLIVRGSLYQIGRRELEKRIKEVSLITGIEEIMDRRYAKLSGGQRRRADIARALLNKPKLLFLDEPTTGLDPKTRCAIWDAIKEMQNSLGMTVFLTTHYMEEATGADKVIIMNQGKIVEEGTPAYLKNKYTKDYLLLYGIDETTIKFLNEKKCSYQMRNDIVYVPVHNKNMTIDLIEALRNGIESFEVKKGNMDEVFLNIIGGEVEQDVCNA